jgi:hypothetical protein
MPPTPPACLPACLYFFACTSLHLWLQAAGFSGDSGMTGPYVFVSMPMFCGADPSLAADAGLTCDMDKHMTWVDVEPNTGGGWGLLGRSCRQPGLPRWRAWLRCVWLQCGRSRQIGMGRGSGVLKKGWVTSSFLFVRRQCFSAAVGADVSLCVSCAACRHHHACAEAPADELTCG